MQICLYLWQQHLLSLNQFTGVGELTFLASPPETGHRELSDGFSLISFTYCTVIIWLIYCIIQQHVSSSWDDWLVKLWLTVFWLKCPAWRNYPNLKLTASAVATFYCFTSARPHSYGLVFACVQDFPEGQVFCTGPCLPLSAGMDCKFFRRNCEIYSSFLRHNTNSCQRRQPEE